VLKQEDAESKARVKAEEEKPEPLPPMEGF